MEMGARVNRIVRRIMVNNPGRSVPSVKVKSFRTAKEVGSWIFSRDCFDRDLRTIIGDFNFNWIIRLKEFRHPARDHLSAMSLFAPALFLVFSMFGFVLQISALVTEKELKLRQAMSMMGLCESTYWLSWIVSEGILCCSCKKSLPYHTLRVSPLDSQQVLLMNFFEELEGRRAAFSIGDIQLGLSTLQENFLTIAREAELETATVEG
ncbi:ABC transporter A family member 11 [Linum perenne]